MPTQGVHQLVVEALEPVLGAHTISFVWLASLRIASGPPLGPGTMPINSLFDQATLAIGADILMLATCQDAIVALTHL